MPKTITQLTAAASADPNAVVAADNAAGTLTEKVTLQQIADLATATPTTWQGEWDYSATYAVGDFVYYNNVLYLCVNGGNNPTPGTDPNYWVEAVESGTSFSSGNNNGDVLTWNSSTSTWGPEAPSGIPTPVSPNQGDTLIYDTGNWIAQAPSGGLPAGMSDGDVLTYSSSSSAWVSQAPAAQLPTSASTNDILSWNGSAWVAIMPSTPGLPSGSTGQSLVYDGSNWVAGSPFPSASTGQYLYFDGTNWSGGSPLPTSGNTGDVLTYDSMMNTWSAQAPSGGGGLTAVHAKSGSDETASSMTASTSVTVIVQGSATYLVHGLALLEVPTSAADASLRVDLSMGTADGSLILDFDVAHDQTAAEWGVDYRTDQTDYQVISVANTSSNSVLVPIRFRGYLTTNEISSTNLRVVFGDSGSTDSITLKASSWLVAIRLD